MASGVEKIFLIAFGAGEAAGLEAKDFEACFFGGGAHAGDGALVQFRVADDAAFADEFLFKFELRLDEDEESGIGLRDGDQCGDELGDRDKRDVDSDEGGWFGEIVGLEEARIFLDGANVFVALQFPVELRGVDVDGVDAARTVLKEAIGETAVRCADVEAEAIVNVNGKIGEGAFELCARTAGVF